MSKYMPDVLYLESSDFTPNMSLKPYVGKGKPVVVMCQGNYCGYCTTAKNDFVAFCKQSSVVGCTLQVDDPSAKDVAGKLDTLDKSYKGVPTYLGFDKTGRYVKTHQGGRDTVSIIEFAKSL